jgi:hypothetical protein
MPVTGRHPRYTQRAIEVACRSGLPRARSYPIVVLGSACEAASCTSRSGTPASSAAVMNACLAGVPLTTLFWTGTGDHLNHEYQFNFDLPQAQAAFQRTLAFLAAKTKS